MEKESLKEIIALAIDFEGKIRVALEHDTDEALALARQSYLRIGELLNPVEEAEAEAPVEVAAEAEIEAQAPEVEEKPAEEAAKNHDLRKFLTINDIFRFKRELFDGNEADLNATIDLINSMTSADEAEEYITGDLMLDPENADVKDFIEIIGRSFK